MLVDGVFFLMGYFSDPVNVHIYEQEISFFHHISSFLTMFGFYFTASILKVLLHLICSSIMGTLEVHYPFIKVGFVKVCSLSCQFYIILMRIVNFVCISKEKSNTLLISLLKFPRKIPKRHFRWVWELLNANKKLPRRGVE